MKSRRVVAIALLAAACSVSDQQEVAIGEQDAAEINAQLPLVSVLPFVGLLLAIALAPLLAPRWWHSNRHKALVAAVARVSIAWRRAFLASPVAWR